MHVDLFLVVLAAFTVPFASWLFWLGLKDDDEKQRGGQSSPEK